VSLLWVHFGEGRRVEAVVGVSFGVEDSNLYIVRCRIRLHEICLSWDLLYERRTQIQERKNMDLIIPTATWTIFMAYLLWYMISVRRNEPITKEEASLLWKIHKKTAHCSGQKWKPLTRKGGKLKGFKCECGYHYTQKRPLVAGSHKALSQGYWNQLEV
jgi:hypothetical protein